MTVDSIEFRLTHLLDSDKRPRHCERSEAIFSGLGSNKEAPQFPEGLLIKVGDIPLRGTSLILFAQPPYPTILLK